MTRRQQIALVLLLALSVLGVAADPPPTSTPVCASAPPSRLILRERARVGVADPRPLNLRAGPATDQKVNAQIPAGGVFYVLGGPTCNQSYAWYNVEYKGIVGWIAEGDVNGYYAEIYPPGT